MPNSQIHYVGDYVSIVCSLCNVFRPPLVTSSESDGILAKQMMLLAKSSHSLQSKVFEHSWDKKRVIWKKTNDSNLKDFPELMENELRGLTMCIYQLKQAESYTDEHFDNNGLYEIMTHNEEDNIIKAQIQSHHISSKTYTLWVEYNQVLNPITEWYWL